MYSMFDKILRLVSPSFYQMSTAHELIIIVEDISISASMHDLLISEPPIAIGLGEFQGQKIARANGDRFLLPVK